MERWVGRIALVTGASAGLGAEFCRILVKHGMKVVGCARNVDKIKSMCEELKEEPGSLCAVKCDLQKEEDILYMFQEIKDKFGGIDVCINNAGFSTTAPVLEGSVESWKAMMDVNVIAVALCTKESVKLMKSNNIDDGHIINISSMAGHRLVGNGNGFYSATKFALNALTEATRRELRDMKSKIRISIISPGMVETEFMYRANPHMSPEKIADHYKTLQCLESRDIAEALIYILGSPAHVQVHDLLIRPTEQTL